MFGITMKTTNIGHQILQRETNICGNTKDFAANIFRERFRIAKNLYKTDLKGHFGCVNAIEFSNGGTFLASGGDDKRVLAWDVEKALAGISTPRALATEQASNIFCLSFDSKNRKLISGGNDTLAITHDFETGKLDNVFKHDGPVYGLSIDPQNDNVFSTASENGEILLFDQRSTTPTVIASVPSSFHAVEFHPRMGNLLVTANSKRGATLYDIRYPKQPVILYGNLGNPCSCMSVRFNRTGKLILGLRRRLPPILYDVNSPNPICTFYHSNYYNSCTMKSCTFAGEDDELVLSGSDDFNLYVWRLSDIDLEGSEQWVESTQMVLYGHRSIVNQVRYNREKCLLASSGVEKIIKIWSPFSQHNWTGSLTEEASCSDNPRELYSPYNLFTMALPENWHHLSHDYSSENTSEDPRMMAFFDSLIQQEIEEWETNSSTAASEQEDRSISSFFSCGSTTSSNSSSSDNSTTCSSSSSSSSDSDNSNENFTPVKRKRRSKRQAMLRKKIQRKNSNKKSKMNKNKCHQLQKPTNRIAYLIAKKRNTLRRLAIKGSSLNNRHANKTALGRNEHKRRTNSKQSHRQRTVKRRQVQQNLVANGMNSEKPTTSAVAAVALAETPRNLNSDEAQKKFPQLISDPKSSPEEDSGNFAIKSSNPSNATNNSCSSNNNNVNVPSTSTGITSNFRDAFLRLSRQIFMSDSDDDELENDINKLKNNLHSRYEGTVEKKTNGANKPLSSKTNSAITKESRATSTRYLRSNQCLKNSTPINVINYETTLPQRSHPIKNENSFNNIHNNDDHNKSKSRSDTFTKINGCKKTSRLLDTNIAGKFESSCPSKNHKKRRCTEVDSLDDFPTTSSSNSKNLVQNESFIENTASTSASTPSSPLIDVSTNSLTNRQEAQSPLKRRKISISDYIKVRRDFHSSNFSGQLDHEDFEFNNNETNNNDIFAIEEENINNLGQLTPQRSNLINRENNNLENFEYAHSASNNSHLFTPDSGISLNISTTPTTGDQNDILASTSTTATRIAAYLSPCYELNNCDVKNIEEHEPDDDEGVVVANNRKSNLNQFQKKVARVRRNYRKQFFDDTESD